MNAKYLMSSFVAATLALTSCADLDTAPEGSTVTSDQKKEVINDNPERGEASVRAVFSGMNVYMPNYTALSASRHNDFGYSSIMMCTDANTEDQSSANNGYNWAGNDVDFYDRTYTSNECQIVWNDLYQIIYAANNVCASYSGEADPADDQGKFFYAQGLASRASMYLTLAQLYQFTYKGNESKPCVPIITDANSNEAAANGAPRATVEAVYAQIKKDIDHAIALLTSTSYTAGDSDAKRYISKATAYGIRARMNLVMQNWADAASDAENAIKEAEKLGIVPATITDVSLPYFTSRNDRDFMWCIYIEETDDVVTSGIVNWISHCGTFNYGYGQYSGGHQINKKLYNQIPETDVRKGWWSGADSTNTHLDQKYNDYLLKYKFPPYTNCKFGTYDGTLGCSTNANDIPLMRVEEMYLIRAEALAKAGEDGKTYLENFVKQYRDPAYTCTGDVQEAVYFQKRIELWGEGLIWFDVMRLNKGIDRRGGGFDATFVFNIPAGDPILLWRLPQTEINANSAISDADNNETVPSPTPVADTE